MKNRYQFGIVLLRNTIRGDAGFEAINRAFLCVLFLIIALAVERLKRVDIVEKRWPSFPDVTENLFLAVSCELIKKERKESTRVDW